MWFTPPAFILDEPRRRTTGFGWRKLTEIVGWDGVLPLVMALGPLIVRWIWAKPPFEAYFFLALSLPTAALARAHLGWHQIAKTCGGHTPWYREVGMALAIMLLFAFEASVSILTFAPGVPLVAWSIPVAFYFAYVGTISVTLMRPVATSS